MRSSLLVGAALAVAVMTTSASAANMAVSKSSLGSMGFGTAQVMSDQDGLLIRGKGVSIQSHGGHAKPNCHPAPPCHAKPACPPPTTRHCFTPPTCTTKVH